MVQTQTLEGCNDRYFGVTKELTKTNTLVWVIISITWVCFPLIVWAFIYIYSELNEIQLSLQSHEMQSQNITIK